MRSLITAPDIVILQLPSSKKAVLPSFASPIEHKKYVEELREIFVPLIVRLHTLSNPHHNPDDVATGVADDDVVALANMGPSVIAELKASNLIDPTTGLLNASASSLIHRGLASTELKISTENAASPGETEKDIEAALTIEPSTTPKHDTPSHAKRTGGDVGDMDIDASSDGMPLRPFWENVPVRAWGDPGKEQHPTSNKTPALEDSRDIAPSDPSVVPDTSLLSQTLQSPPRIGISTSIPFDATSLSSGPVKPRPNTVSPLVTSVLGVADRTSGSAMPMPTFPPQPARQL